MTAPLPPEIGTTEEQPAKTKKSGKRKLILIAVPVVLVLAAAGIWFTGILPHMGEKTQAVEAAKSVPPSYVDFPEMTANLNVGNRKPIYIKLEAKLEVPNPEDVEKVRAVMPRVQSSVQTYLRDMRPEELVGAVGTYRLREEFLVSANAAVAPAKVSDVLFTHMVVQ
jgi:flagellar FliL protein